MVSQKQAVEFPFFQRLGEVKPVVEVGEVAGSVAGVFP
jgi:hypothetical protein